MSFTADDLWCALSGDEQRLLEFLCDDGNDDASKTQMREMWPIATKKLMRHSWGRLLNEDGSPTALGLAVVKESPDWKDKP